MTKLIESPCLLVYLRLTDLTILITVQFYADPEQLRDTKFFLPRPTVAKNKKPMNQ